MLTTTPPRAHRDAAWYARPAARAWISGGRPACEATAFHVTLPGYAPTPLREMPALAAELGVGKVFVKDESARMGLPAFKILGASWAAYRALVGDRGPMTLEELAAATPAGTRLVTATEGNHGRAVAHMARLLGLPARIFVPAAVDPAAVRAIAAEGAEVGTVPGSYDEAVRAAAGEAASVPGSVLVQDTAWPGYVDVPRWIVEGYATLYYEIDDQLAAAGAAPAALVAVPMGVGSLAQAAVAHYRACHGGTVPPPPTLLGVEPGSAACVLAALRRGEHGTVPTGTSVMAGLNCGTPSSLAWPYLRDGLDAAVAVGDAEAVRAVRDLAALGVTAGPSGAASLAGARAVLLDPDRRAATAAGPESTVVLLVTEGAR
ncbi:diaminopropionate ammonia-lyase [Thermocatellispora tengchongensis]|uniref:Diaminopropionate ammonia-lyase n=1 Tax=Thermocatellispora tengchongensis TaxID=1073253 RepID=A0A840NQ60_9ACTN|nr:diaminopropionate ammonia-lyase [Thermocatellispora tengchongensis]MBB5130704.1 diaminopropionate ammonia-lyase [Thermocatellispora tengchongensis]